MKAITGFAMFLLGLFLVAASVGALDQAETDILSVLYVSIVGLGLMLCGVLAINADTDYVNSRS